MENTVSHVHLGKCSLIPDHLFVLTVLVGFKQMMVGLNAPLVLKGRIQTLVKTVNLVLLHRFLLLVSAHVLNALLDQRKQGIQLVPNVLRDIFPLMEALANFALRALFLLRLGLQLVTDAGVGSNRMLLKITVNQNVLLVILATSPVMVVNVYHALRISSVTMGVHVFVILALPGTKLSLFPMNQVQDVNHAHLVHFQATVDLVRTVLPEQ